MSVASGSSRVGMDSRTLAGSLDTRLKAIRDAGFEHVMLWASDLHEHEDGLPAAIECVRTSGLRITGLQLLRDFEGTVGIQAKAQRLDQARELLELCRSIDAPLLLLCSNVSTNSRGANQDLVDDLREIAVLAEPHGVRIAYEALSWGHAVRDIEHAHRLVRAVGHPLMGLAIDAFHMMARDTPADALQDVDPDTIFVVQVSDFSSAQLNNDFDRIHTARHARVFPGSGSHDAQLRRLMQQLDRIGYRGDWSLEVFNDEFRQRPAEDIAREAALSGAWLALAGEPRHTCTQVA